VPQLLTYLEAVLRVYNQLGRRDNLYKARIKILVHQTGVEAFTRLVEDEFAAMDRETPQVLPGGELARIRAYFQPPAYAERPAQSPVLEAALADDAAFAQWHAASVSAHKQPGYGIVTISLKPIGGVPGDATAEQMEAVAELAERHGFGEIRVSHEQNLVLPDVALDDLPAVWQALDNAGLGTPNIGLVTDIIACPGLDYCNLANARSIPVAQEISERFADLQRQHDIGELKLKISGCINACGHHHVGHIGILGVDKKGVEHYQITLGGDGTETASLGDIIGPAFPGETVTDAVETIIGVYLDHRTEGERFLDTYRRIGLKPFKEVLYAAH